MAMLPRSWILIWISMYLVMLSSVSNGSGKWCSNDAMEDPCYFIPNVTPDLVDWETAWSACKGHGATLPTIDTKQKQDNLESVLKTQPILSSVWIAGREVRTTQWTWSNGRNLTGRSVTQKGDLYFTQAVMNNTEPQLQFRSEWPKYLYHYICQYSGNCSSRDSIRVGTDCFVVSNDRLSLVGARNRCMEGGGDLATFEDEDAIRSVTPSLVKHWAYWIGLRQSYWVWNKTDSIDEVRYSNWMNFLNIFNQQCIFVNFQNYMWEQSSCSERRRVLCQTDTHGEMAIPETTFQPTTASTESDAQVFNLTLTSCPSEIRCLSSTVCFSFLGMAVCVIILSNVITAFVVKRMKTKTLGRAKAI